MPKFTLTVTQRVWETITVEVEAATIEEARKIDPDRFADDFDPATCVSDIDGRWIEDATETEEEA